jgi:hypothetical protein
VTRYPNALPNLRTLVPKKITFSANISKVFVPKTGRKRKFNGKMCPFPCFPPPIVTQTTQHPVRWKAHDKTHQNYIFFLKIFFQKKTSKKKFFFEIFFLNLFLKKKGFSKKKKGENFFLKKAELSGLRKHPSASMDRRSTRRPARSPRRGPCTASSALPGVVPCCCAASLDSRAPPHDFWVRRFPNERKAGAPCVKVPPGRVHHGSHHRDASSFVIGTAVINTPTHLTHAVRATALRAAATRASYFG